MRHVPPAASLSEHSVPCQRRCVWRLRNLKETEPSGGSLSLGAGFDGVWPHPTSWSLSLFALYSCLSACHRAFLAVGMFLWNPSSCLSQQQDSNQHTCCLSASITTAKFPEQSTTDEVVDSLMLGPAAWGRWWHRTSWWVYTGEVAYLRAAGEEREVKWARVPCLLQDTPPVPRLLLPGAPLIAPRARDQDLSWGRAVS